jgi:hypothetical protein
MNVFTLGREGRKERRREGRKEGGREGRRKLFKLCVYDSRTFICMIF